MSSPQTTLFNGKESIRYSVREKSKDETCIQDIVIQHILIEPEGNDITVITATGGVCESALDTLGAARDGMLESLRP